MAGNRVDHTIRINFKREYYRDGEPVVGVPLQTDRVVDSIHYQPAVLRVMTGDTVQWKSNFNLKVSFHRGTPLGCSQVVAQKPFNGNPNEEDAISDPQRVETVEKKGYHYNVHGALVVNGVLLVFGDPNCPEIIVE